MKEIRNITVWIFLLGSLCEGAPCRVDPSLLVSAARMQVGVTIRYDPAYQKIPYPNGDLPKEVGVCSDVVVRALRRQNIDHRRVPNLMTFFQRRKCELPKSGMAQDYMPGDIVAWNLGGNITHIGIVSDRKSREGVPLIIHNIGRGVQEENILFQYEVIGHYRLSDASN